MATVTQHCFQWYNYKRPTFCAHCGNLLVGATKQGKRCKRCDLDVHHKCQEIVEKSCIELFVGHHNFREKSYTQLTYCDYCKNLLVGFIKQGKKCSECGANVHEKCQTKIEVGCKQTQSRLAIALESKGKSPSSSPMPRSPQPLGVDDKIYAMEAATREFNAMLPESKTFPSGTGTKQKFPQEIDSYPEIDSDSPGTSSRPHSLYTTGHSDVSSSGEEPNNNMEKVKKKVDEVIGIFRQTVDEAIHRGDNLDGLHKKSVGLEEKARLLKKTSKEIKSKTMWKNYKMWIALIVAAILIIIVIAVTLVFASKKNS